MTVSVICWHCQTSFPASADCCPSCEASNKKKYPELAKKEAAEGPDSDGKFHDWEFHDESFSHEFGTEVIRYDECSKCGLTRDPVSLSDEDFARGDEDGLSYAGN